MANEQQSNIKAQIREGAKFTQNKTDIEIISVRSGMVTFRKNGLIGERTINYLVDVLDIADYTLITPTPSTNDVLNQCIKEIEAEFFTGFHSAIHNNALKKAIRILTSKLTENG